MKHPYLKNYPDAKGYFGKFGGAYLPPELEEQFTKINAAYDAISKSHDFLNELRYIRKHYQGRPTPIYYARNLSRKYGGAIYLKREDLNHTGAHKLNHCMAEALLAKHMGKKRVIAETGAGQHGVALATAAAYFGMECEIHMGEVDIAKEKPNVTRMKMLGANVVAVNRGARTLKEAVDSAFESYLKDPEDSIYAIGSVVGPHPFPKMVRDFQSVVGHEAKEQFQEITDELPSNLVACVGGGSNALGIMSAFIDDAEVKMFGVEPHGKGEKPGEHAASLTYGSEGIMHGFNSIMLQEADGAPGAVHSVASGLDYPSVGPEHAFLNREGRVKSVVIDDSEAIDSFFEISRLEGIIPAIESAHAIAFACKLAVETQGETILVNLSGRGDKDIDYVAENYGFGA